MTSLESKPKNQVGRRRAFQKVDCRMTSLPGVPSLEREQWSKIRPPRPPCHPSRTSMSTSISASCLSVQIAMDPLAEKFVTGHLKERTNLDFLLTTGRNSFTKFLALNLVQSTTELIGEYSHHVMSLTGQYSEFKLMAMYAPTKRFGFTYECVSAHVTNLSCETDSVLPQATLILYEQRQRPGVTTCGLDTNKNGAPPPPFPKVVPVTTCV
ncbi:hypothetical protein MRX96_010529 [Rhipicephalus microplus]